MVCTHVHPDGDGLGSMLALAGAGRAAGRETHTFVADEIPRRYESLFGRRPHDGSDLQRLADSCDAIVIVDTASRQQLAGLEYALDHCRSKLVVIDHHATAEPLADAQWVDSSAAAAGVMVGELIDELDWPMSTEIAEHLATAVLSDTGWLRFSSTDGRCLRQVASWVDRGVSPDVLYARMFQQDRIERLKLLQRVLASLELRCDGRLAVMSLRTQDFAETGAGMDETENLINESLRLATVQAALLLVETPEYIRVSLRSRGGVDVSQIARNFGGGGHVRAAGLKVDAPLEDLRSRLVDAFAEAFQASC